VATNDQARALNAAIREQVVASGHVDDDTVATTGTGQRVGVGDLIVTRDNDHDVNVANRDTWTVTAAHADGSLIVTPTSGSGLADDRTLPAGYVSRHRRHIELGYAGTVHGIQGRPPTPATWSSTSTPAPPAPTSARPAAAPPMTCTWSPRTSTTPEPSGSTPPTAATPTSASTPPARPPITAPAATPNPPPPRPASARPPTSVGSPTYSTSCAPPGPTRPTPAPR
jgi:hypothetical protein